MPSVSSVGPKLPSADLVARVLQPEIIASIISYLRSTNGELCRLLKVSRTFYHEAVRFLYRSTVVHFIDRELRLHNGKSLSEILVGPSNQRHWLVHTRDLIIESHEKTACSALEPSGDSNSDSGLLAVALRNLKTVHFSVDNDVDCDGHDCPLTRGLHPPDEVTFTIPLAYLKKSAVERFKAAIARLSSYATSVTIDFGCAPPALLYKFITLPLGDNVTNLEFTFDMDGEDAASAETQRFFTRACKALVASLKEGKLDQITVINFIIWHIEPECCSKCTKRSTKAFDQAAVRYKSIWERKSRNLPASLQTRVSVEWYSDPPPWYCSDISDSDSDFDFDCENHWE